MNPQGAMDKHPGEVRFENQQFLACDELELNAVMSSLQSFIGFRNKNPDISTSKPLYIISLPRNFFQVKKIHFITLI